MRIEFGSIIKDTFKYEQKFLKEMKEKYQFLVGKYFGVINPDIETKEYKGKILAVNITDSLYLTDSEDLYFELEIKYHKKKGKDYYYCLGDHAVDSDDYTESIIFADSEEEVKLQLELTEF